MAEHKSSNTDQPRSSWWKRWFDRRKLSRRVAEAEKTALRHTRKFLFRRLDRIREVRQELIAWSLVMVCLFISLIVQISLNQTEVTRLVPSSGGFYREGSVGLINSLNPLFARTRTELAASQLIFSRLYQFDNAGRLKGDLAKSLAVSSDEKTYTITIRDNVKWHDDQPLTVDDIVFTIKLLQNPDLRTSSINSWQGIKVKKISDFSLELRLPTAYAPFRYALTFPIVPEHILKDVPVFRLREAVFSRQPVGSGMFRFQSMRTTRTEGENEQILHLAYFDDYYGPAPFSERFELSAFTNKNQLLKAMKDREVSAATDINLTDVVDLKAWHLHQAPIHNGSFVFLNTDRGHLREVQFRQALRQAIDLTKVRRDFNQRFGNYRVLNDPLLPASVPGLKTDTVKWFDSEQAAAKLVQLGYQKPKDEWQDANGQPVALTIVAVKSDQSSQLAESIATELRDFGLTVKVDLHDLTDQSFNFVRSILKPRNYDLLVYEIELGADPDQFAYWHSSQKIMDGLNFSNYSNAVVDDLLSSARVSSDPALRLAKYQAFLKQWQNDVPAIAIHQSMLNYAALNRTEVFDVSSQFVNVESRFADVDQFAVRHERVYATP